MKYDVFLICPVRNASDDQKSKMQNYISDLENQGKKVYYPARDTNQNDITGYNICLHNKEALLESKEVHIYWDKNSKGSLFDLGIAFGAGKQLVIVNPEDIEITPNKSFENMITYWAG